MTGNLKAFVDDLIRYAKYLPPEEKHPLEMLVLKWHLLIEEQLRYIVESKFVEPSAYDLRQAKYSMLLRLSRALYGSTMPAWEWEALHQVNVIRNSLAHSLEDDTLIPRIEEKLFKLFSDNDKTFSYTESNLAEKLGYCLSHLHAAVLRVKHKG